MVGRRPSRGDAGGSPGGGPDQPRSWWPLGDQEIHYLWWYIQGSIMEPDVRRRLHRAWGMCQRHAWGALAVEASYRHGYLHGPAILYEDLLGRARRAFAWTAPGRTRRVARRLRSTGPCLMCDLGLDRTRPAAAREELLAPGRDPEPFRALARRTAEHWRPTLCGRCLGDDGWPRCRVHLLEDLTAGRVDDLTAHERMVQTILDRVTAYRESFRWERRDTETDEDRAGLLSAVGWCSGWAAAVALLDDLGGGAAAGLSFTRRRPACIPGTTSTWASASRIGSGWWWRSPRGRR